MGHVIDTHLASEPFGVTLISMQQLSDNISTFTFELPSSINGPLPGGFGVFEFSETLDSGYSHMKEKIRS